MPRQRLNQANLTANQWTAFANAVKVLKAQTSHPNYDDFPLAHMHSRHKHQAHASYTFFAVA